MIKCKKSKTFIKINKLMTAEKKSKPKDVLIKTGCQLNIFFSQSKPPK